MPRVGRDIKEAVDSWIFLDFSGDLLGISGKLVVNPNAWFQSVRVTSPAISEGIVVRPSRNGTSDRGLR